jgi:signal transduction histidine kinase
MKKPVGLRRRWLLNTVLVVCILGLICVAVITAAVYSNYYSTMESDLRYRAKTTAEFFADYQNQNYNDYYQSCITYAQTFDEKNAIELQFINVQGRIVASSYGLWSGESPTTDDISSAINTKSICSYVGQNPQTGERILAVSAPMIYSNGEVIGLLRYVTSTGIMDLQIVLISAISLCALIVILLIVLISGNYFIHSILVPVGQITEKAKRITGGSYGIQIEKHHNDEIGELVDIINDMSLKISENEKIQTEFISSLSHELRTPLTAIKGWSETILSGGDLDAGTARGMKIIQKEADRLTNMVLDLLDFTKIQDGRMTLNMETADLRGEFEDLVFVYGSRLAQEGIKLEYLDNDVDIPPVTCDPKRLRQVYLNILDNAAKHGGDGKRIEASIALEDGFIVVRIRDYGPGIPEDELSLVKKKFYKGSSKARGSGIGLAVCDEIVNLHGGTLNLSNAEGGGTVVTVSVPASQ